MNILVRKDLRRERLPGRLIEKAIGKDGASVSGSMTMGFASYSEESGQMEAHCHAKESVYILNADKGWVEYGKAKDDVEDRVDLRSGMVLHIPEGEWHRFCFLAGGCVDIIFFYGQVGNIRPEEA